MSKRNLVLLFSLLAIASCSSNKKTGNVTVVKESPSIMNIFSSDKPMDPQIIYFDEGSDKLDKEAISTLNKKVFVEGRKKETKRVNIEGYCGEAKASALSAKRVKAAKVHLIIHGVKAAKIRTAACSKSIPAELDAEDLKKETRGMVIVSFKR
jgi:outer membrane protein OmpA-like peptidoglycan-associated protein